MTPAFAALGVLLVIVAIPLGLMLAPLAIGVLLVWFGLRRLGGVLEPVDGPAPAMTELVAVLMRPAGAGRRHPRAGWR